MTQEERLEAEIHAFIVSRAHLDYIESDRNADLIVGWLDNEGLPISAESLHAAYVALHDELDVYPRYAPTPAPAAIPPAIPQAQTPVQAEPSTRLHVAERLPGESRLSVLQRSFAEEIAAQRIARLRMREEAQSAPPRKTNREINNGFAAMRKPRGRGAGLIIGEEK